MLLRVQHVLENRTILIKDISKLTLVDELREKAASGLNISKVSTLQLICKGKILEDGQTLFNYRLEDGLTILARERPAIANNYGENSTNSVADTKPKTNEIVGESETNLEPADSNYFHVGQAVDVQDEDGTWYEARIEKICIDPMKNTVDIDGNLDDDGLIYFCRYENESFDGQIDRLSLHRIRPRAYEKLDIANLFNNTIPNDKEQDQRYLVNYNVEKPGEMGDWYEAKLKFDHNRKTRIKAFMATIFIGSGIDSSMLEDCKITKLDEIYIFQQRQLRPKSPIRGRKSMMAMPEKIPLRSQLDCRRCFDNPSLKPNCPYCMCVFCQTDDNKNQLLVCEECYEMYHTYCLTPALPTVPEGDWYCTHCKNDDTEVVKTGDTAKLVTQRMLKMPSANPKRHGWGGGHSCDGLSKKCTAVPPSHFGPIPGIEVGTCWRYRKQVSEAGVHRPLVCGIHGRENDGAYSIVVAGGYEDDEDHGDRIIFTGSGGRDLSGNKRVANQSKDQTLDRNNAALARNCYSASGKLSKAGGEAGINWQKGKPVRVVRSSKLGNKYSPMEGYRYDGIFKVVRYWSEKGKEGYKVWRYELVRDDKTPAPWTKKGVQLIREKGLDKIIEVDDGINDDSVSSASAESVEFGVPAAKRPKLAAYQIPAEHLKLIKSDEPNVALWKECLAETAKGAAVFFEKVKDTFLCAICQEIVHRPATLSCGHSLCLACISTATKSGYGDCPSCRTPMEGKTLNKNLSDALEVLFPGYGKERMKKQK